MMTAGNSPLENSFEKVPKRSGGDDMIKGKKPLRLQSVDKRESVK